MTMFSDSLDALVDALVACYDAHTLRHHNSGQTYGQSKLSMSCSCGWGSGVVSKDLRPQWAAVDEHLIDVLPGYPREICWCGRAILLGPYGAWFHAERGTHGHDATPQGVVMAVTP